MKHIPCINCITLAICKNFNDTFNNVKLFALISKCCLLRAYVTDTMVNEKTGKVEFTFNHGNAGKAIKYLNGEDGFE